MGFGKKPAKPLKRRASQMVVLSEKLGPAVEDRLFEPEEVLPDEQAPAARAQAVEVSDELAEWADPARAAPDPRVADRRAMKRRLAVVELGPDHPVWWPGEPGGGVEWPEGAIVRLRPPAEPRVDPLAVKAQFEAQGCAVRVAPAELADAVIAEAHKVAVGVTSRRDVVLTLVWRSRGDDEQRRELERYCEDVIARVGL